MAAPSPFDSAGLQFAWDSTSIKLAQACLRKYQYVMLEGWRSRTESDHLTFGAAYATALEHFYKSAENLGPDEALREVVREALTSTWGWQSLHNTKNRETLIRSIVWYLDEFRDDPLPILRLADGRPALEHTFLLPVDDNLVFTGHIDRLVEYSGGPYVMDQKTTASTVTPYWFEQFSMDTQMSMYTFAGRAVYGTPVKGVIIDAAQIAVGFTRFTRGFTFRTDGHLDEWYGDTLYHISLARRATAEQYFPTNPSSCNLYGGCAFRKVCSRSPEHRLPFLKGDFIQAPEHERWNPLRTR